MSFCIGLLFHPWLQIHLCCPLLILPSNSTTLVLAVTEVVPATTSAPKATGTITMTGLIFMVLIPLLSRIKSKVIGNSLDDLLVGNGLPTSPLSRTLSVSYASPSATQPHNVLTFAAVVTSPLLILLLVRFLPLLGSRTLVRTTTLRLILRFWPILHPILVMITYMLMTIRVYPYPILDISCYVHLNIHLHYLMFPCSSHYQTIATYSEILSW